MSLQNINKYINSRNEIPYIQIFYYLSNYLILFITNHLLLISYNNIYVTDIYISSQIILLFHSYVQYNREKHLLKNYAYRDFVYNKVTVKPPSHYLLSFYLFTLVFSSLFIVNCILQDNIGLAIINVIMASNISAKTYYSIRYNISLFNKPIYYHSHKERKSYIEHFKNIEYPKDVYI
jgi:hypothetical protein